jgi:hypothetical protein
MPPRTGSDVWKKVHPNRPGGVRPPHPPPPMRRSVLLLAAAAAVGLSACTRARVAPLPAPAAVARPAAADHAAFTAVLAQYVDAAGQVDYAGLKASRALGPYLEWLAATDPSALPEADRIAFWLNAYNASTLKLVVDNYPTKSILRITPVGLAGVPLTIPGTPNSPFRLRGARIGGRLMSLDEIEHDTLRGRYREPRIHAALVCAAVACPPLRREAYTGAALDAQLTDQMQTWLADPAKNRISAREAGLSPIFSWFKEDFGGTDASVQRFIAPYAPATHRAALEQARLPVRYLGYDWSLNDQARNR